MLNDFANFLNVQKDAGAAMPSENLCVLGASVVRNSNTACIPLLNRVR
jgi:hypothetical protein